MNSRPHVVHAVASRENPNGRPHWQTQPRTRAGTPTTRAYGGRLLFTIEPAPTMQNSPMVIPGRMIAPAPSEAPCLMRVGLSQPRLAYRFRTCARRGDRG